MRGVDHPSGCLAILLSRRWWVCMRIADIMFRMAAWRARAGDMLRLAVVEHCNSDGRC